MYLIVVVVVVPITDDRAGRGREWLLRWSWVVVVGRSRRCRRSYSTRRRPTKCETTTVTTTITTVLSVAAATKVETAVAVASLIVATLSPPSCSPIGTTTTWAASWTTSSTKRWIFQSLLAMLLYCSHSSNLYTHTTKRQTIITYKKEQVWNLETKDLFCKKISQQK